MVYRLNSIKSDHECARYCTVEKGNINITSKMDRNELTFASFWIRYVYINRIMTLYRLL